MNKIDINSNVAIKHVFGSINFANTNSFSTTVNVDFIPDVIILKTSTVSCNNAAPANGEPVRISSTLVNDDLLITNIFQNSFQQNIHEYVYLNKSQKRINGSYNFYANRLDGAITGTIEFYFTFQFIKY